jgi:hypothetical protein
MTKLQSISGTLAILLSAVASASLLAQVTTPSLQNDSVTTPGTNKVQLPSARQEQLQGSHEPQSASFPAQNQDISASVSQRGIIQGTVTDINDAPVPGATVVLRERDSIDVRSVTTNEHGFFEISDVEPGRPYQVSIRAEGFSEWDSPVFTLELGGYKVLNVSKLRLKEVKTAVTVTPSNSDQIAMQQVETAEKQRGFVIVPNFYAVYVPNPAPLRPKLKFRLALRVARDPFTLAGVAVLAGIGQAADNPQYGQGAKGYAERFGANYANSFTDVMLYAAILPSLLHQDPRYFYQGTGTIRSRALHALSSIIITRGDDRRLQPNYSELGGDLASSALSNLYYPQANRGVGRVFQGFAINSALHVSIRLLAEFVFRPSRANQTPSAPDNSTPK